MDREIVIVMGFHAAGKSTLVDEYVKQGYHRINRDLCGGTLDGQAELAKKAYLNGHHKIVLDNTYITIESRESIIAVAKELKVPIRCVHLATSFEDAQLNACLRMVKLTGHLLSPEEMKKSKNPNLFPPVALFGARKDFYGQSKGLKHSGKQTPKVEHGFDVVERKEFVRTWPDSHKNKAIILDYDGTVRKSRGKEYWPEKIEDVKILPNRKEVLQKYQKDGYLLLGASNQSAIAKGLDESIVIDCFKKTNELLGLEIEVAYCPHRIPPMVCYCRKPSSGMGALFIIKHKLDPKQCIMVGDAKTDQTFAERCGFQFKTPEEFFR